MREIVTMVTAAKVRTLEPKPPEPEVLPSRRCRDLCEQMAREGKTQIEIADELDTTQGTISKIVGQGREAGIDIIWLAHRALKLKPEFFFGQFPNEPNYHDFVGRRTMPEVGYQAFFRFVEQAPAMGLTLTAEELAALKRQDWDAEPTLMSYSHLLHAIRAAEAPSKSHHRLRASEPPEPPNGPRTGTRKARKPQ